jgi:simple sugar transport system ATP-binding protein
MLPEDRRRDGLVLPSSILRNVSLTALGLSLTRLGLVLQGARSRLVREQVERLRITPSDPRRTVATLSGGNQQKVLLARMLALAPRAIILDEPTRGIDVGAKVEVQNLVSELADNGLSVMFISAELEEVLRVGNRVAIVQGGRIVDTVPSEDLTPASLTALVAQPGAET